MDLDSASTPPPPIYSRKSSLSLIDKSSFLSPHRRRSSASQIVPIVSQGLFAATANGLKRSPLAPLDPQFSATLYSGFEMAHEDGYSSGRKSSIALTNATRPTPYSQRNLPRRPLPGQPRRTSLPALHPSHDPPPQPNPIPPFELAVPHDEDADIYSRLSTFTFGDAPAAPTLQSSIPSSSSRASTAVDDGQGISPLHRVASFDKTPRPSVVHAHAHAQSFLQPGIPSALNGWSSPSEDEEERRRTNTRSKMRAIDDGTRRPSLPINDAQKYASGSGPTVTGNGNGKPLVEGEASHQTMTSSQSLQTEVDGDLELDTDVDLMSIDDTDGRKKEKYTGMSDRSSMHDDGRISSDVGSMYEDGEDEARAHNFDRRRGNEDVMKEEDLGEGNSANRKDSARTYTERTGRRGSLPMDIPYPNSSHSSRASHTYHDGAHVAE
ncbi:hypothetical protein EW145_g8399, partial [Phellinidium pouzarii]